MPQIPGPQTLRIALLQINPVVGDFAGNLDLIKRGYEWACIKQAHLVLTPEMSLCGYPPLDLLDRSGMLKKNELALKKAAEMTKGQLPTLVVGHVSANPSSKGKALQNRITVLGGGEVKFSQAKTLLPTYDVFDEDRYFEPAHETGLFLIGQTKIAFAICEDLWANENSRLRKTYYGVDPVDQYEKLKPDLLVSISASPFYRNKNETRERVHSEIVQRLGCPLIYINQVGAHDELIFDGGSFMLGSSGIRAGRLESFESVYGLAEFDPAGSILKPMEGFTKHENLSVQEIRKAIVLGIKDYFSKTGHKKAVLGLSGGIDSALVATLAVEALGAGNVTGVLMPSPFSSSHSLTDAQELAQNLGIQTRTQPIKFMFSQLKREMSEGLGELAPVATENLQSRLRGVILMAVANHQGALLLTTGNKSEIATGYGTLYGDMAGAIAPIGDLYKTQVYELARSINQDAQQSGKTAPIPVSSITKAPSAELKPGQVDQDSLPEYDVLDKILQDVFEYNASYSEILKKYPDGERVLKLVEISEFKRRQAAPVLKVSSKAFGLGRRIPIAKRWSFEGD